jgi:hypothetical protein
MKIVLGGLIGFVLGLVAGAGVLYYNYTTLPSIYTGRVMFTNDANYSQFKSALLDKDVQINKLNSLSSDQHFVDFSVTVPHGQVFPFGKTDGFDFPLNIGGIAICVVITTLMGCLCGWSFTL